MTETPAPSRSPRARPWTQIEDELLIEHHRAGKTFAELEDVLSGRASGTIATRVEILRRRGADLEIRKARWSEEARQRLATRYRAGATRRELCEEFDRTQGTIGRQLAWMRANGYDLTRDLN